MRFLRVLSWEPLTNSRPVARTGFLRLKKDLSEITLFSLPPEQDKALLADQR
jgi:hypothetical protein